MTFGGSNFSGFYENQLFQKMMILVHFEDEGIFPPRVKNCIIFQFSPKLAIEASCFIANVEWTAMLSDDNVMVGSI